MEDHLKYPQWYKNVWFEQTFDLRTLLSNIREVAPSYSLRELSPFEPT
jgi:hypothetical protein